MQNDQEDKFARGERERIAQQANVSTDSPNGNGI